jgi:aspartyl/glutamyl-tRNA(Asn/Gln) amidotransferase C subunit
MPVEIDIDHVAKLARVQLTDDEKARMRSQLAVILEHAAKVGEVAADDVAPTASPMPHSRTRRPRPTAGSWCRRSPRRARDRSL